MNFLEKKEAYLIASFCTLVIMLFATKQTLDEIELKKNGLYRTAEVVATPKQRKSMFSVAVQVDGNRSVIGISKEKASELVFYEMDTIGVLFSPNVKKVIWVESSVEYSPYINVALFGVPIWFFYIYFKKRSMFLVAQKKSKLSKE